MLFKSATSRNIFSTVALGVVTTIGVAATIVGITYGTIRGAGIDKMQTEASKAAAEVNRTLSVAHQMVAGLDDSISTLRAQGVTDRELVMAMLTTTLEGFPGAIGLSTGWEPNAFDGKDAEFAASPYMTSPAASSPTSSVQGARSSAMCWSIMTNRASAITISSR